MNGERVITSLSKITLTACLKLLVKSFFSTQVIHLSAPAPNWLKLLWIKKCNRLISFPVRLWLKYTVGFWGDGRVMCLYSGHLLFKMIQVVFSPLCNVSECLTWQWSSPVARMNVSWIHFWKKQIRSNSSQCRAHALVRFRHKKTLG